MKPRRASQRDNLLPTRIETPQEGPCCSCLHVSASLQRPAPSNPNAPTTCLHEPQHHKKGLVTAAFMLARACNVLPPQNSTLHEGPRYSCLHVGATLRALPHRPDVETSCMCATSRLSRRNVRKRRRHGSSNNALHEASWCVWRARRRVVVRVGEEDRAQTPSAWQLWRGPSCRVVVHVKVPGRHVALD